MPKLLVKDLDVFGKRVLVRVDFNVPIKDGLIFNNKRLRASVPTIVYLAERGAKVILISHLGRPGGNNVKKLSLKSCAVILSKLIGKRINFFYNCVGKKIEDAVDKLANGEIILLENLRFHIQETQNDSLFSRRLANLADLYVNDAFGTVHRSHASTEGVTNYIKTSAMGFLINKEISHINVLLNCSRRLFIAVLGGAKISDKIGLIDRLVSKVDYLILGGGMVYTFFKAKGLEIGDSVFESDKVDFAANLLKKFGYKFLLPVDCMVTNSLDLANKKVGDVKCVNINSIESGWSGIDIGLQTSLIFSKVLCSAKTVFWNGPLGIFEISEGSIGTFIVARAIGRATQNGAYTFVGGGDSILAIEKANVINKVSHVSTGGGASLRFIEGKKLPGIMALSERL